MLKRPTKILQALATIAAIYCAIAILIVGWPASGLMLILLVFGFLAKRRHGRLTTLGSARWADVTDLRRAGMFNAKSGLILGRVKGERALVRLPQAIHTFVCSPSGGGKGVSLVIPHLLLSPDPCCVMDFKGELAKATAEHRRKTFKQNIVLLDPFRVFTQKPDTFNPLDFIDKSHRLAIDDCNEIANALIVRTGEESERHWNDSAEGVLAGIIATVVAHGEVGTRSLNTVQDILCHPQKLDLAIKLMLESNHWGGALAKMGGQFLHFQEKEKASVLSTALRHVRFLGTPTIADSVGSSSFDPTDLRKGGMTIYMIIPPDKAQTQSGLLRMWIGSLLRTCVQGGLE